MEQRVQLRFSLKIIREKGPISFEVGFFCLEQAARWERYFSTSSPRNEEIKQ